MEWPHDPDGEEGSEGGRVYGQAIFAKKVDADEDFPLDFAEFAESVGHHPIRLDSDKIVPAADILDAVDVEIAETFTEFHQALGAAMREGGFWTYDAQAEAP